MSDTEQKSEENTTSDIDIYRDTPLRYLGYANEVGEAFRSMIGPKMVLISYGIASAYVFADTISKTMHTFVELKDTNNYLKKTVFTATDTLLWQMFASVIIPGYTINRTCRFASRFLQRNSSMSEGARKWTVTSIGLSAIPVIIRPIDNFVDDILDITLRKFAP